VSLARPAVRALAAFVFATAAVFCRAAWAQEAPAAAPAQEESAEAGAQGRARSRGLVYVTPSRVIYPRQTIRPDMLEAREADLLPGGVAQSFDEAIGKAARATLLPGRAIPLGALGEPEIVRNGGPVTLVFRAGGLDIRAAGVSLQAAAAGERIRVRNVASGVIVAGALREDATVLVETGQ
jgi:flagella basal body P-ring formation protein FlgA